MASGDLDRAVAVLDDAIARGVDLVESYRMRAGIRMMLDNPRGSIDDLTRSIELKPDDADQYEQRAMARLKLGEGKSLILEDLDSAIAKGKKQDRIYFLRATVHKNFLEYDAAIADYNNAIEIRPGNVGAHVGIANIYLIEERVSNAIDLLVNFLSAYERPAPPTTRPGNGKAVVGTIVQPPVLTQTKEPPIDTHYVLYSATGSNQEKDANTQKLEDASNIDFAYTTLAAAYLQRGEAEMALATIEKVAYMDRAEFFAFATRGRIRVKLGYYKDGINDLNVALRVYSLNPFCFLDRGIAYLMTGRKTEARSDFEKYLELRPYDREILARRIEDAKKVPPR